jgi:hypothetical protein
VTTHAVGDDEEPSMVIGLDDEVVFVAGSDHPDVSTSSVEQKHYQPFMR